MRLLVRWTPRYSPDVHVNVQSEKQVQEAIQTVSRSRTTVCIAHRLSTIKTADKIIVMSQGEVVEEGTHDDLYAMNGIYHGLVDAQNLSAESDGSGKAEHSAPLHDSFTIEAVTADTDPSKDYTAIASS